jgi:hypothetical protein
MNPASMSFRSANGAAPSQPRATPWVGVSLMISGLKARDNRCVVGSGLQPSEMGGTVTQGVALGWLVAGALPRRNQPFAALDAECAEVLGNIGGLLA